MHLKVAKFGGKKPWSTSYPHNLFSPYPEAVKTPAALNLAALRMGSSYTLRMVYVMLLFVQF